MFKLLISLFLLFSAITFSGCLKVNSHELGEVSFDDKKPEKSDEVVITDADISRGGMHRNESKQTQTLADNSEIVTMFDAYGNKVEKRYFKGHGRVQLVLIRTAFDGNKQIFVYGYGTEIVTMPEDFSEKALSASADEIASAAELKTTKPFKPAFPVATPTPLPTPARITIIQPTPQVRIEETPKPEIQTSETTETTVKTPQPKEENEF